MSEQTANVDGLIQALISTGSKAECIASEEKHPKPEIREEDELKRAIQEMLIENTGCNILDSGGAYGRGWEKNRSRDFENEKTLSVEVGDDPVIIQYNTYKYLVTFLEITEESRELDRQLQKAIELYDGNNHLADMQDFMEEREQDGYDHRNITNTYNYDNILSEVLQYGVLINEDTDEHFIILQIHNGCDVRGGYTKPRVFSLGTEDNFCYFLIAETEIRAYCEKCHMGWDSDDCGYNWRNDGHYNSEEGLDTDTEQEDELKIVCDRQKSTAYHKNCGGKVTFEVLEG